VANAAHPARDDQRRATLDSFGDSGGGARSPLPCTSPARDLVRYLLVNLALYNLLVETRLPPVHKHRIHSQQARVIAGNITGEHRTLKQKIIGFHRDDDEDWVADLECGHQQHVRHKPPSPVLYEANLTSDRRSAMKLKATLRTLTLLVCSLILPSSAYALEHTFISPQGNDSNTCARAQACRTFAGALAKTDPGGIITAFASGVYDPVVVNKAVTITAEPGAHVSIVATTGAAITVSAGASDVVAVRNLHLIGRGDGHGIYVNSGKCCTSRTVSSADFLTTEKAE
jgi:hypothetical protein